MTCLIKGCNFVLRNIPHEAFVYAKHADSEFRFQTTQPDIFPYLLVNIGSGVSIVKVTGSALLRVCECPGYLTHRAAPGWFQPQHLVLVPSVLLKDTCGRLL